MFNKQSITMAIALTLISSSGYVVAQRGNAGPPAQPRYNYGWKSEEFLLLGDANRGGGEPMIAVDPTNPKNIVVVAMASLQALPPEERRARTDISRSTITTTAVSHNGGISWNYGELPMLYSVNQRCPDPFLDVTKDGTFLAGCEVVQTAAGGNSSSSLMISTDKGENWGPRVELIGWDKSRFAPGLTPAVGHAAPFDRPYLAIDDATGTIYAVAQGGSATTPDGKTRGQAYITASTDGGKTFGTIYAWESKDYPQLSRGTGEAAAFGEVAVIYTASSVPASAGAKCPCPVMGLSHDLGKTFAYRVIQNVPSGGQGGGPGGPPSSGMARLTSDPTKEGRYSILSYIAESSPRWEVVTSENHGETWSRPVLAGSTPDAVSLTKPAFKFSRTGLLALVWRAIYKDGTYDIWTTISKDSGRTFSNPVRVSHAKSPATDPIRIGANDDIQDISIDNENVHMVWGDFRAGLEGVFYGRVPISTYEFSR